MFTMGTQKKAEAGSTPKGSSFLGQVKDKHEELFAQFIAGADQFDDPQSYTEALEAESWKLIEGALKTSYANGVAVGQRRRKKGE